VEYRPDLGEPGSGPDDSERGARSLRVRLVRAALFVATLAVALLLPFVALVRLSVYFYAVVGVASWTALALAALAVVALLFVYVLVLRLRFQRKLGVPKVVRRALMIVVAAYLAYALIYLSGTNAKTEEIRSAYAVLSPLLRVATGTVLLVDRDAVVTDTGRRREDYIAWGLPVNEASLHFEQDDGFVHAVDLRTVGRPEWRSRTLAAYYWAMGFRTLRHVGTADHLHVSLPVR
jgi:hypothetical protein